MTQKQQARLNVENLEERSLMSAGNLTTGEVLRPVVPHPGHAGHLRIAEPVRVKVQYDIVAHARPDLKQSNLTDVTDNHAPGQAAPGSGSTQSCYAVYYRSCVQTPWTYYWSFASKREAQRYSNWIHHLGYQTFVYRYAARSM